MRPLTLRRAAGRVAIVAGIVGALLVAAGLSGVGPLAHQTPPSEVTDPGEQLARSLQAVIDASAVHVEAVLSGSVPGALVGRSEATVKLDGTRATLDLRPQDARTHLVFTSPPLDTEVEAITSWDTMGHRLNGGGWQQGSLGSVVAGTGIDANPLTLVDRLRDWLADPGAPSPSTTDAACAAPSGRCRQVTLDVGPEAGALVLSALPGGDAARVGPTTTRLVLLTEVSTLQPSRLLVTTRSADGSLAVTLQADFTLWNWPSVIPEPPG